MSEVLLSKNDIRKFQHLFNLRFGVKIDPQTARRKLSNLVRQMELIYRPISMTLYEKYVNKDEANEQIKTDVSE